MQTKEKKKMYQGWTGLTDEGRKAEKSRQETRKAAAATNAAGRQTNAVFASENEEFKNACIEASVEATPRQASKYRRKRGQAYNARKVN